MSTPQPPLVHVHQPAHSAPPATGRSATPSGVVALVLAGAALFFSPVFLLIPYVGFFPALIAGGGAVIAGLGLRGSTRGTATAVTGLIVSVIIFALLAGIATMWNFVVADPAIRDYDELHEVIDHIKQLIFG
ncbi:hypothetical protein N8K70_11100 [Microbacterium betulae]|uniref:Uncharacterized protein n=1 Tax=Microbacterium betulae TaxID=2981139 RepID=A0AA97FFG3_9MICO|nr:hypothetical protein [Microbacterium sp. AB]WOF21928.1 hypothetical protein N8K70_11100 [Microbacterium sp. AB]